MDSAAPDTVEPRRTSEDMSSRLAEAALARLASTSLEDDLEASRFAKERDLRQQFRRLIDPGIVRVNKEEAVVECVKCLLTLGQNILDHPDEEKYRKFKTTNTKIKKCLVETKGGLEYAAAMGYREKVENFQPSYVWRPSTKNVTDLRVGVFVLKEHQEKIQAKQSQASGSKPTQLEAAAEIARTVKLAFEEDRSRVARRADMERQARLASMSMVKPTSPKTTRQDEPALPPYEDE